MLGWKEAMEERGRCWSQDSDNRTSPPYIPATPRQNALFYGLRIARHGARERCSY